MNVRQFSAVFKPGRVYRIAVVEAGRHRVEVAESPSGRSVQVHVDGVKVYPDGAS